MSITLNDVESDPSRLSVGIVGGGRVGTALGVALARAGHRIVGVTPPAATSGPTVTRLQRRLPQVPLEAADVLVPKVDLVLLAVPDDALPGLVSGLAETGVWRAGQLVVHVSGGYGLDVLQPALQCKALPLALHPVMTFTGRDEDIDRLTGISYGVTAPEPLRPVAEALAVEMGGEPVWIPDSSRPLYHAGLVVAANYVVALLVEAKELLQIAGVERPQVMLGPLVSAAVDNGLRLGDAGLTGPVVRADARTVATHLTALRAAAPEAVGVYVALARRVADRAIASGLLRAAPAEALLEVLAENGAHT